MKPKRWLDLIDLFARILAVIRRVLTDLWQARGDIDAADAEP